MESPDSSWIQRKRWLGPSAQLDKISPETCRSHAIARFDAGRMARDYLRLYAKTIRDFGMLCAPQENL